jgi:tetratricopeptide (TPR) repeat protein
VQSEIAQVVCTALSLRVNMPKAGAGGTRNFAAYDTYLRAMALYRADKDEANDREALALLERAVELDANFSLARATAAYSSVAIANAYASPEEGKLLYARAIEQARIASEQSPDLAIVQLALGFAILYGTRKVKDALSCYDKAYGLAAGDTQIAVPYSLFSSYLGRAAVSIEAAQRVMGLDPLNASTFRMAGLAYYHARQYDEALPLYAKAIALKRDVRNVHGYIGNILVHREQYAEARKEFEQETRAYISQPGLAIVLKAMGDRAGAERVLADFLKEFGDAVAYQEAQIRAQWGDKTGAMQTLQRAYAVMDSGLLLAKVDPMLDPVRGEPGFSRLLNDLGLA